MGRIKRQSGGHIGVAERVEGVVSKTLGSRDGELRGDSYSGKALQQLGNIGGAAEQEFREAIRCSGDCGCLRRTEVGQATFKFARAQKRLEYGVGRWHGRAQMPHKLQQSVQQRGPGVGAPAFAENQHGGGSGGVLLRTAPGAGYVAIFINEIQELIVALDGARHQDLGIAFARFRLLANIAFAVEIVEIILIIAFQVKLLDLFRHRA
jgi:hypothetical protein